MPLGKCASVMVLKFGFISKCTNLWQFGIENLSIYLSILVWKKCQDGTKDKFDSFPVGKKRRHYILSFK